MKLCIVCDAELKSENWPKYRQVKKHYLCTACNNKKAIDRPSYLSKRTTTTKKKIFDKVLSRKIVNMMSDAKKRGYSIFLSYEDVGNIMKQPCFYCGDNSKYSGIDRINSEMGYVSDNIVPCCAMCNFGKNAFSVEQYIQHCVKVVMFQGVI